MESKLISLIKDLEKFKKNEVYPKGFNIFEAVGMRTQEIKHSNFLGFLLNPKESHPFSDKIARAILLKSALSGNNEKFSALKIALNDYSDLKVKREWGNQSYSNRKIDIVISSMKNKAVFVIENKVFSSESKNQLHDYKQAIYEASEFDEFEKHFIFLTPDSTEPTEEGWIPIDYAFIIETIEDLIKTEKDLIGIGLKQVLLDYCALLRRNVVEDYKLIDECKRIYEIHKKALDLIFEHGDVNKGPFADAAIEFFKLHKELKLQGAISPKKAVFLPENLEKLIPNQPDINWHQQSKPVLIWFYELEEKFQLIFEVGPLPDEKIRNEIVKKLRDILGYRKNSEKEPSGKYSRVWTKTVKVNSDDESSALKGLESLWQHLDDSLKKNNQQICETFEIIPKTK